MITLKLEALTWSSHDLTFFQASNLSYHCELDCIEHTQLWINWLRLLGSWDLRLLPSLRAVCSWLQFVGQLFFLRLKFAGHEHCVLKGNDDIGVWFSFFLLRLSYKGGSFFTSEWVEFQAPGARFRSAECNFSESWFRRQGKIFNCDL